MGYPAVTNTFTNGSTSDATGVNTNFTDLINGASDGTKDYNISALTCAGAATFNGNVTVGNGSVDDLSISASLASDILIKTTATYNFGGSTLGLLSLYFGRNSQTVRLIGSSSMSATYTYTLPLSAGSAGEFVVNSGSGSTIFLLGDPNQIQNYSLSVSYAASAMTIALKTGAAADASSTTPIYIPFRSSTLATGTYSVVAVTAALSVVVSSGSTLGRFSGRAMPTYIYAINNAGTVELAVSTCPFNEQNLVTTTAEGGGGAADSNRVMYSTTARTSVAFRLIGVVISTQTTAGTWAQASTRVSCLPFTPTPIMHRATRVAAQNHDSGQATFDRLEYDTIVFDPYNMFDAVTNNDFIAPFTGIYTFQVSGGFGADASTGAMGLALFIAGAQDQWVQFHNVTVASDIWRVSGVVTLSLTAADQIRIYGYQNKAATLAFAVGADVASFSSQFVGYLPA